MLFPVYLFRTAENSTRILRREKVKEGSCICVPFSDFPMVRSCVVKYLITSRKLYLPYTVSYLLLKDYQTVPLPCANFSYESAQYALIEKHATENRD